MTRNDCSVQVTTIRSLLAESRSVREAASDGDPGPALQNGEGVDLDAKSLSRNGAVGQDRTVDLSLTKDALYH